MGLIVGIIAGVLCCVLYIRMCRRDVPVPMGKKAAIPVALGCIAPILSTVMFIGIGFALLTVSGDSSQSLKDLVPTYTLKSLVAAFLTAGFPEELVKFLFLLLSAKLVKPKSVYEWGLLGAGVGVGFTFLEEMLYGGGNVAVALFRMPFFAMHMVFDLIMGLFLGLAAFDRKDGREGALRHTVIALVVPLLWHVTFDAATTFNTALTVGIDTGNDFLMYVGATVAVVVIVASVVLQFWELVQFKRKSGELCAMRLS